MHRVLQIFIYRWTAISKSLEVIAKPYSVYGPRVNTLPFDKEDRKRKVYGACFSSSSQSAVEEESPATPKIDHDEHTVLRNFGYPQSPPIFFDNECTIGLAHDALLKTQSKSMDPFDGIGCGTA